MAELLRGGARLVECEVIAKVPYSGRMARSRQEGAHLAARMMGRITIFAWQEAERPQAAGGLRPVLTDVRGDQAVSSLTRLSLRSRSLRPWARHAAVPNLSPARSCDELSAPHSGHAYERDRERQGGRIGQGGLPGRGGRWPGVTRGLTPVAGTDRAGRGRAPTLPAALLQS